MNRAPLALLALTAATMGNAPTARAYAPPIRFVPRTYGERGRNWRYHPPRSRTDVAFALAAGRDGDARRIVLALLKRERKNARRLAGIGL